jgi:hypothetical protein
VKKAQDGASMDGFRAHQIHLVRSDAEQKLSAETRARRNQLEMELEKLREKKKDLSEQEYYRRLEGLMVELARIYEPKAEPSR